MMLVAELENELKWYCLKMKQTFYGLTRNNVMRMAFKMAEIHESLTL